MKPEVVSVTMEVNGLTSIVKNRIFKVEYLKKYKILQKSEKKCAIPLYSNVLFQEHFKIGMESLGEHLRKEIGPKVCRE